MVFGIHPNPCKFSHIVKRLRKVSVGFKQYKRNIAYVIPAAIATWKFSSQKTLSDALVPNEQIHAKLYPVIVKTISEEQQRTWASYIKKVLNKLSRYLAAISRIGYCIGLTIPAVTVGPIAIYFGNSEVVWNYITWAIEAMGPTFIKLAQWASTRPDLFPENLIIRLERFQSSTRTHPWSTAEKTLRDAFGPNWSDTLKIDKVPIGSGCIAQVYKGSLVQKDGSEVPVAVKLIHPHVKELVTLDMEILQFASRALEVLPRLEYLALNETIEQFAKNMEQQLDLTIEALNIETFARNFKDQKTVVFPTPIDGYRKKNALVETYMTGEPISIYMRPEADPKVKLRLSDICSRAMLQMVFKDNFVHGDLHPGNIMVQFIDSEPRIVLLDCGIVTKVADKNHAALVDISLAFLRWDGNAAANQLMDHTSKCLTESADAFKSGVQAIVDKARRSCYFEHIGEYISQICYLSCAHRVKMVSDFLHVALAVKVVEGISLALDPDLDLTSRAIPVVMKMQAQYYIDRAIGRK